MSRKRRIAAAVFCACFLLRLTSYATSREELYFVAVENMVTPLSQETMPFWRNGYLYISSDIFTGAVRDALGVSRAKIGDGVLLYRGEQSLLFRKDYPYAQDSQEETYAPGMAWYQGSAYVPASVVARVFNLTYSMVNVRHGKLVWLRSASFKMQDAAFAKAAEFQLNAVYQEYLRSLEPSPEPEAPPEEVSPEETPAPVEPEERDTAPVEPETSAASESATRPATPSAPATTTQPATPSAPAATTRPATPSAPATTAQPVAPSAPATATQPATPSAPDSATTPDNETPAPVEEPRIRGEQRIYLCLRGDANASALLDALERHSLRAAFFCDETFLSEQGDLLRRMAAAGHRIGLYVPAGPSASVLERLEVCNKQLRRVTMEKTRLVYADGAGDELLRAVRDAGFVCLRPALDRTQYPLRTSRQAADLLNAVAEQSDSVAVWLGGTANRSGLNAFINDALEVGDAFPALNETLLF